MERKKPLSELPLEERLRILGMLEPPTPEELAERRAWGERVDMLREKIGPIDIRTDELVHMTPEEVGAKYGGTPS